MGEHGHHRRRRRLLLASNSTLHGGGYLDHCQEHIAEFLGEKVKRVLFVPYALHDQNAYAKMAREKFESLGYGLDSIHEALNPRGSVREAEAIFIGVVGVVVQGRVRSYVFPIQAGNPEVAFYLASVPLGQNCLHSLVASFPGGGNTFRLLKKLYDNDLIQPIRKRVLEDGIPYIGSSAGTNVATVSISTTNDMPIVYPPSFLALGLVPFNINPHYLDADVNSTHMGETREKRIQQYHEEPNTPPVLGMREGSLLLVEGDQATLQGKTGARLFVRGKTPTEHPPGTDFSFLLNEGLKKQ